MPLNERLVVGSMASPPGHMVFPYANGNTETFSPSSDEQYQIRCTTCSQIVFATEKRMRQGKYFMCDPCTDKARRVLRDSQSVMNWRVNKRTPVSTPPMARRARCAMMVLGSDGFYHQCPVIKNSNRNMFCSDHSLSGKKKEKIRREREEFIAASPTGRHVRQVRWREFVTYCTVCGEQDGVLSNDDRPITVRQHVYIESLMDSRVLTPDQIRRIELGLRSNNIHWAARAIHKLKYHVPERSR